ncbi:hypothetical protein PMI15_02692 [Polaromonas sp. CF318]|uniref:hypothetical protein n=1 Tax=Polaromonas sp. CF318 TaxID=1144318 RepID=UPI000271104B|nr:hypothetical protein [Polaromonas sp. CF318]EJL83218.1 hypothetical protein PMI15_02692 [Polaromonas sp. CF318]
MYRNSEWSPAEQPHMEHIAEWYSLWSRWVNRGKRRIPQHWPLHARVLMNSEELRVWHWMINTFDDHHVLVKMPVTRFTRPNANENSLYWYEMLQNTTCTFSVCASDGHVVGCVDVPKSFGLSRKARNLKSNLLAQCGICYVVLNPSMLPDQDALRNEFLGEEATKNRHLKREEAMLETARLSLKNTLAQQRQIRTILDQEHTSSMPNHWHDSFLIQSNTRPAELR